MNAPNIWKLEGLPFIQRAAWMLVHSVWQATAAALLLAVVLLAIRNKRAPIWTRVRYTLACCAMLSVVVSAVVTFACAVSQAAMDAPPPQFALRQIEIHSALPMDVAFSSKQAFDWHALMPMLVLVWAGGVLLQSVWHSIGYLRVQWFRRGEPVTDPRWLAAFQQVARGLRIGRAVQLVRSARIDVPAAFGVLRPVIVIPLAVLNDLSIDQAQAILAHEPAHIRRFDYAVNLIQTAVETVFFYHPAVWWISAQIRRERENCCDDIASDFCGSGVRYAQALVALERGRAPRLMPAATGGSLLQRVRRLLNAPVDHRSRAKSAIVAFVTVLCVFAPVGWEAINRAQAQDQPATKPSSQPSASVGAKDAALIDKLDPQMKVLHEQLDDLQKKLDFLRETRAQNSEILKCEDWITDVDLEIQDRSAKLLGDRAILPNFPFVDVIIGSQGFISVDDAVGNWQTLRERIEQIPASDRGDIVIALKAETGDLPVGQFFAAQAKGGELIQDLHLAYLSLAGIESSASSPATRPTEGVVYIGGRVRRPGVYSLGGQRLTVMQLVITAGGTNSPSGMDGLVTLIRRSEGADAVILKNVSYRSILSAKSPDVYLRANDVVYVVLTAPAKAGAQSGATQP